MNNVTEFPLEKILESIDESNIATRKKRFFGFLLTNFAFISGIAILAFIGHLFGTGYEEPIALGIIISIVLHIILLIVRQQTIGMIILKTKIVSDGSKKLSKPKLIFWRIVMVWVLPYIPYIQFIALFNYANILGNRTNRCIYDELSNSIVVNVKST